MTLIKIKYLGNCVDTEYNGWFNALGKQAFRGKYLNILQNSIKNIDNIDKIIDVIGTITDENTILTPNTVFTVKINDEEYFLSNTFKIIPKEEFKKLDFVPYIIFDKNNCDIQREIQNINEKLKYKTSSEAIEFVKDYILNLPKSYKYISDKPNEIILHNIYDGDLISYPISKI